MIVKRNSRPMKSCALSVLPSRYGLRLVRFQIRYERSANASANQARKYAGRKIFSMVSNIPPPRSMTPAFIARLAVQRLNTLFGDNRNHHQRR
jgi:hypothetical protein